MSGLGLDFEAVLEVAAHGLRKSRTLQAVHMSGLNLRPDERIQLRQALKIKEVKSKVMISDPNIDSRHHLAQVDLEMVQELFRNEPD